MIPNNEIPEFTVSAEKYFSVHLIRKTALIIKNNNNNGFKQRFDARRRHRGPPFDRVNHQFIIIIGGKPERRGKEKMGTLVGSVVSMCPQGGARGGKRGNAFPKLEVCPP